MKTIVEIIDAIRFRLTFGFSKRSLSRLYVELLSRDDSDWAPFQRNGLLAEVKNTALKFPDRNLYLSIGGDYGSGQQNKVFKHTGANWEIVLDVSDWKKAKQASAEWLPTLQQLLNGKKK